MEKEFELYMHKKDCISISLKFRIYNTKGSCAVLYETHTVQPIHHACNVQLIAQNTTGTWY